MNSAPVEMSVRDRTNAIPEAFSSKPALAIKRNPMANVHPLLLSAMQPQIRPQSVDEPQKTQAEHQEKQLPNLQIVEVLEENRDANCQDTNRLVLQAEASATELPSSQQDETSDSSSKKERPPSPATCPKCGKQFSSGTSLRTHLGNVFPCDQARPLVQPKDSKLESKTCPKCGKTFASWQGLRGHLNRIKPCDQAKPPQPPSRKKNPAKRTCTKCGKTFSSSQSLRIHLNRLKPCDLDKRITPLETMTTTSPISTPTATPMPASDDEQREAERKARARYQSRKAYLKRLGRLHELGNPPTKFDQTLAKRKETAQTAIRQKLKRRAPDNREIAESVSLSDLQTKRPRQQSDASVSPPSSEATGPTPPVVPSQPVSHAPRPMAGRFVHQLSKGHGGDLLAGGCSCPPCVRRWARKLMNRMQQLEDEVLMLRQKLSADGEASGVDGVQSEVTIQASCTLVASTVKPNETLMQEQLLQMEPPKRGDSNPDKVVGIETSPLARQERRFNRPSNAEFAYQPSAREASGGSNVNAFYYAAKTDGIKSPHSGARSDETPLADNEEQRMVASCLQAMESDQKNLVGAYSYMNDQILMKERAVDDSISHVHVLMAVDKVSAANFRRQVDELKESICAEKNKRDIAAAALIVHKWQSRSAEFNSVLESMAPQNLPDEAQACHVKWAELTTQIAAKDKLLLDLEKQIDLLSQPGYSGQGNQSRRSRYEELGGLSSKIAAEHAAKGALSAERDDICVGLVKSSFRIRLLVRRCLLARGSSR